MGRGKVAMLLENLAIERRRRVRLAAPLQSRCPAHHLFYFRCSHKSPPV